MEFTKGKWADITNRLTAREVIEGYSCYVWINGQMETLHGQNAIDYLAWMAEDGVQINGMN